MKGTNVNVLGNISVSRDVLLIFRTAVKTLLKMFFFVEEFGKDGVKTASWRFTLFCFSVAVKVLHNCQKEETHGNQTTQRTHTQRVAWGGFSFSKAAWEHVGSATYGNAPPKGVVDVFFPDIRTIWPEFSSSSKHDYHMIHLQRGWSILCGGGGWW